MAVTLKTPLVSIIILNYNGQRYIAKCLSSVLNTEYPNFEVIFVDNHSTDGSIDIVRKVSDPRLKIIVNDRNYGYAKGNNIGVKYASGKYIVFLNVDTEVDSKWLKYLVEVMESDESIGGAQAKIIYANRQHVWSFLSSINPAGEVFLGGLDGKHVTDIFFASGCCSIYRKDLFERVGGFDEDYFMYVEDVDLGWRLRLFGYRIVAVPEAIIYHVGGGVSKYINNNFIIFLLKRNRIFTLIKNLLKYLPVLFIHYILIAIVRPSFAVSSLKAILSALFNLKKVVRKRRDVQLQRRVRDPQIIKLMRKVYILPTTYF